MLKVMCLTKRIRLKRCYYCFLTGLGLINVAIFSDLEQKAVPGRVQWGEKVELAAV